MSKRVRSDGKPSKASRMRRTNRATMAERANSETRDKTHADDRTANVLGSLRSSDQAKQLPEITYERDAKLCFDCQETRKTKTHLLFWFSSTYGRRICQGCARRSGGTIAQALYLFLSGATTDIEAPIETIPHTGESGESFDAEISLNASRIEQEA